MDSGLLKCVNALQEKAKIPVPEKRLKLMHAVFLLSRLVKR